MPISLACVSTAQGLFQSLGARGFSVVEARADAASLHGDYRQARFWRRVSQAMRLIDACPCSGRSLLSDGPDQASLWTLMQRIEAYRHLATQAEAMAAEIESPTRDDLLGLATAWRELAIELEASGEEAEAAEASRSVTPGSMSMAN